MHICITRVQAPANKEASVGEPLDFYKLRLDETRRQALKYACEKARCVLAHACVCLSVQEFVQAVKEASLLQRAAGSAAAGRRRYLIPKLGVYSTTPRNTSHLEICLSSSQENRSLLGLCRPCQCVLPLCCLQVTGSEPLGLGPSSSKCRK